MELPGPEQAGDAISVLIIDDQPLYRLGVAHALSSAGMRLEVVGEASDGQGGLRMAQQVTPSVVLLNAEVDGLNGLEAIREIKHQEPNIRVVVMTTRDDEEKLFYAIKYGAAAYMLKSVERGGAVHGDAQR